MVGNIPTKKINKMINKEGSTQAPTRHPIDFNHPDFLDEIIVYCKAGVRSREACEILHSMGYQKLNNLQGGMMRWQSEKMPTLLE